jgi:hypothetical protein
MAAVIAIAAGLGTAGATTAAAAGAPANDNFEHAATISGTRGSVNGTTLGATAQPGEPDNQGFPATYSVWYAYTAPAAGTLSVDTCENTTFFSTIAVWTGNAVGSLAGVPVHPDGVCSQARIAFNVTRSTTYRIAIDDLFGDPGPFTLGWTFTPATAPLIDIGSDATLNCFPRNVSNDWLQFWSYLVAVPAEYSCATVVSVPGVGLFGPREFADSNGLVAGQPLHSFTAVSQSIGAHRVRTTVALPGTGLTLVQTESYRRGTSLQIDVDVRNSGATSANVVLYRTGDCFKGDDISFAITGAGSVGCEQARERGLVARPSPGDIFIRYEPLTVPGTSSHDHATRAMSAAGGVDTVRRAIATGAPLANTCECGTPVDAAAALSWSLAVPAHGHLTASHLLTMSTGEGRDRTTITGEVRGRDGHVKVSAHVTTAGGRPLRGVRVLFERGSFTACSAITDRWGRANCRAAGDRDAFTATYFGDTTYRPAGVEIGRTDTDVRQPPSFPACAQFDPGPSGLGLVIDGDGHYQTVIGVTLAPPCPTVLYRARSNGVVLGAARGDLRTTSLTGQPVTGLANLYLDDAHASGCIVLESVDLRTGAVIDTVPSASSGKSCLDAVGGQKFR